MKDRDKKTHAAKEPHGEERRQHKRLAGSELPNISAFIRRGQAVRLIDVSQRGALLETDDRLCPGRNVSLRFVARDKEFTLSGYVVRSWVSGLSHTKLVYRTALSFAEDNPALTGAASEISQADAAEAASAAKEPALELVAAVRQTANQLTALFGGGR